MRSPVVLSSASTMRSHDFSFSFKPAGTFEEAEEAGGFWTGVLTIMNWAIMLSANLGVMNLLPIPALDGGRLVFLVIEAIRGKALDPNKEGMVHMIGIIILFLLMFFVMFNDIRKIFM